MPKEKHLRQKALRGRDSDGSDAAKDQSSLSRHSAASNDPNALLLFNKPHGVLSQFTDDSNRSTLADFITAPGYYPAGRLDRDSEGLMLLTNDGALQQKISSPRFKLTKTYLTQLDGDISDAALQSLNNGVMLKDGHARAINARRIDPPELLWPRVPPVRFRKHIPTSWIVLSLREGRNRQVRRMTAAIGFPTLRLVRTAIGCISVWPLAPGAHRFSSAKALYEDQ